MPSPCWTNERATRPAGEEQPDSTQEIHPPGRSLWETASVPNTKRSSLRTRIPQRTRRIIWLRRAIPLEENKRRAHLRIVNRIRDEIVHQVGIVETPAAAVRHEIVYHRVRGAVRARLAPGRALLLRAAGFNVSAARVAAVVALHTADWRREGERRRGGGYGAAGVVEVVRAAGRGEGAVVVGGEVVGCRRGVEEAGVVANGEALAGGAVAGAQGRAELGGGGCGVEFVSWRAGGVVAGVVVARGSAGFGRGEAGGEEEGCDGDWFHGLGLDVEG